MIVLDSSIWISFIFILQVFGVRSKMCACTTLQADALNHVWPYYLHLVMRTMQAVHPFFAPSYLASWPNESREVYNEITWLQSAPILSNSI
jgi:hypothetical protein